MLGTCPEADFHAKVLKGTR